MTQVLNNQMIYDRTLTDEFAHLLKPGGDLRWLFDFVKSHKELDFQIGKHKKRQWISIYRGTTKLLTISMVKGELHISASTRYMNLASDLYGVKSKSANFEAGILSLIGQITDDISLNRYYNNKKEGYYQNEFSTKYGICGNEDDDFVIVDKEAVIGYIDNKAKTDLFSSIRGKYVNLHTMISNTNPALYGKVSGNKARGNELDFLALDKNGNVLLIEFKHGSSTTGIYLSPLQIGLYYDIFTGFPLDALSISVFSMIRQKQEIGLINPDWVIPAKINNIIPVLVIADYNTKSNAKIRFNEIMALLQLQQPDFLANLDKYTFDPAGGLNKW